MPFRLNHVIFYINFMLDLQPKVVYLDLIDAIYISKFCVENDQKQNWCQNINIQDVQNAVNIVTRRSSYTPPPLLSRLTTKPTKWPVWSQSLLYAQWVANDPTFLHAESKDSESDPSLRWGHMPFCWFCHAAAQIFLVLISHTEILVCMQEILIY